MSIRFLAAFLAILSAQTTFGQDAPPAQPAAPASRPVAAIDQTTPEGALKLFFRSEAHSDGRALRDLMLASNPAEQQIVDAIADKTDADRQLTAALRVKFPDPSRLDPQDEAELRLPPVYEKIDQSDEQINGDTATLKAAGPGGQPFTLKRVDGKWRIPLAVLFQSVAPNLLRDQAHQIEIQVAVMRAATADVTAGKYASASEAIADVKQKIFNAAIADHAAATQAATQP
jgi:hypothetical protein